MSARRQALFPSLRGQGMIAIDCETYDPGLKDSGPSYHRDGYIVGVAVATEAGFRHYFPVRHEPGDNLDARKVFGWLNDELADPKVEKVFANAGYDLGFLAEAGVTVRGPLVDVQLAEPLINETRRSFSLESLAQSYLGEGKLDDALEDWITTHLKDGKGRGLNRKNYKGGIWRAPVSVVAPYAVGDVDLPLRIWAKQKPLLERLGLWRLFEMESSLIRMVLAMRRRGVAVDTARAEKLYKQFKRRQAAIYKTIRDAAGVEFSPWNARDLGRVFDALGVDYQRTSFTNVPSVTKEWLMHHTHPCRTGPWRRLHASRLAPGPPRQDGLHAHSRMRAAIRRGPGRRRAAGDHQPAEE
jgi:DNA polymerase I-like protein with 3'-5' exonuclease and polymerase domains